MAPVLTQLQVFLDAKQGTAREWLDALRSDWLPRLLSAAPTDRRAAYQAIEEGIGKNKKTAEPLAQLKA